MVSLEDLKQYHPITIQCHDNPDGDAIASGFALYTYFKEQGKEVRLIYSGVNRISKANLTLMLSMFDIPIEYVREQKEEIPGLLITVDCQYGAGNVTRLPAQTVAIIDHHQVEITDVALSRIEPSLGSCSTLVWKMLTDAGYTVSDMKLGTALYYGLYTDTNQLAEIFNPNDMDMRDEMIHDPDQIRHLRQTNLSLQEMEIAGLALLRNIYNDDYHYAVIKTKPCDPNLLGLISDFLIQVAEINSCVVYNEQDDGYKLSVRSCSKDVHANEIAAFVTEGIGSGGGHIDKAGGFINRKLYEEKYPTLHTQAFFGNRMTEFFDNNQTIYAENYEMDLSGMREYCRKSVTLGYVDLLDIFPQGTPVTIRSIGGDLNTTVDGERCIMIDMRGGICLRSKEQFLSQNHVKRGRFRTPEPLEYNPTVKNNNDGSVKGLLSFAKTCVSIGNVRVHAKKLKKSVKIFPAHDEEHVQSGKPGDYLCVCKDDPHNIFIVEKEQFPILYHRGRDKGDPAEEKTSKK